MQKACAWYHVCYAQPWSNYSAAHSSQVAQHPHFQSYGIYLLDTQSMPKHVMQHVSLEATCKFF